MEQTTLQTLAEKAREAQRMIRGFSSRKKRDILNAMAEALENSQEAILEANECDLAEAMARGRSASYLDRLTITAARYANMVRAFHVIADSKDPIGEQVSRWIRPNGLEIVRKRCPIGLVGVALESRPIVVAFATALCMKVNNAVLVVGDEEAKRTTEMLAATLRAGGVQGGLPPEALQVICSDDSLTDCRTLVSLEGLVDLVIPRGSRAFVRDIVAHARIPVLKHCDGICHVYIDCERDPIECVGASEELEAFSSASKSTPSQPGLERSVEEQTDASFEAERVAGFERAAELVINSRCYEPYSCNAASVVLVHQRVASRFLPILQRVANDIGIVLHGDTRVCDILPTVEPAGIEEWRTPWMELVLTVGIVDSIEEAVGCINQFGAHLSDTIITEDEGAESYFMREVDSAVVLANAATCFANGGEFGMGAEVGLCTDKLTARGPIGFEALTSLKYCVAGRGQLRR